VIALLLQDYPAIFPYPSRADLIPRPAASAGHLPRGGRGYGWVRGLVVREEGMKLSEAIRLGAMLRPQAFGGFFGFEHVVPKGKCARMLARLGLREMDLALSSCALGAAIESVGGDASICSRAHGLLDRFEILWGGRIRCPACIAHRVNAFSLIYHLNDEHRWTRERIASWVATIEASRESCAAVAPQEAVTV
jgi:hypothetical protein